MPEEISERVAELVARLDERHGGAPCPLCRHETWRIVPHALLIPVHHDPDRGVEVLALTCARCAFVSFHQAAVLVDDPVDPAAV